MARDFSKKFTDSYIYGIKPTDKEQLFSDRDNLYLLVKPTGAKIWRFIYIHPITKKRIKKSFGNYPSIPLDFARDKARIWCGLLAQGIESIVLLSSPQTHLFRLPTYKNYDFQWDRFYPPINSAI